jgi:uncharacterized RDD family membrane protein YckC
VSLGLPAQARAFQGERAGIISRGLAAVIDFGILLVLVFGAVIGASVWSFFFSRGGGLELQWPSRLGLGAIGSITLFIYLAWGWSSSGKTLGKRVVGLTVVMRSGRRLPKLVAIARAALCVLFPIGLGWCLVSADRASIQDLILRTAVVYDWGGRRTRGAGQAATAAGPAGGELLPELEDHVVDRVDRQDHAEDDPDDRERADLPGQHGRDAE